MNGIRDEALMESEMLEDLMDGCMAGWMHGNEWLNG